MAPGSALPDRRLIEVECPANPGWRTFVPVRLVGTRRVVAFARAVLAGQTLKAEDLTLIEADRARLPLGYYEDPAAAVGAAMNRSVAGGIVLSNQLLRLDNAIVRGQQVLLLAQGEGMSVRMNGRALTDAQVNQRVKVQNSSSGKVVEGIARSGETVEIIFQ